MSAAEPVRVVSCPSCGKPVRWSPDSRFRPFCSERCRINDLGAWAAERYRIPEPEARPDSGEVDRGE